MTNSQPENQEPRLPRFPAHRTIFAVVGFLLPPIGAVIAVYYLVKQELDEQAKGRFILIWSAIGFMGYLIQYLLRL